jgi:hypothetical protein
MPNALFGVNARRKTRWRVKISGIPISEKSKHFEAAQNHKNRKRFFP